MNNEQKNSTDTSASMDTKPLVSCRAILLQRTKNFLGQKFLHFGTGQVLNDGYFTWSVAVSKFFGGIHVTYGGYVVWSAVNGYMAKPCN